MSSKFLATTATAVALFASAPAFASTTIDFETTNTGPVPVTPAAVTAAHYAAQGATFTNAVFLRCTVSFCAASPGNYYIAANNGSNPFSVAFGSAVSNFAFSSTVLPINSRARAFDGSGNLLGTIAITNFALGRFTFNSGGIRSVAFDGFQMGVDNFSFDTGSTLGGVPEPMTWALMIIGFGVIGGAMRRRGSAATTMRIAYA
jgi:hypothetical protein